MASKVINPTQYSYGLMPYEISRNAYSPQSMSRYIRVDDYDVAFIRAPKITQYDPSLTILASYNNTPIGVQINNKMATTFHPELNDSCPSPWHKKFSELI